MANQETREWARSIAITITTEAARGGHAKDSLDTTLKDLYQALIEISEDVESSGN